MIERIGNYKITAELGRGGMGRVYCAYDPSVDREVAIKVLTGEGDSDLIGRFRSEAGTTAKLNHKNIVTVHGYGEQDDMPYLVMELLKGVDLSRVIREQTPLALLEKVRIMYQVAEGLSYAHENSVIHRDIKPANIMLLPDRSVKIMDFGIARVTSRNSTRRTQKGFLLGTISYMAPEQFRLGLDADQLTDIFAYGDVFYELITGVHPFHSEDAGAVMYRITAADPVPVRDLSPECPEPLSYVIQQLLAKDRVLRYQSLKDVLLDLEPVLFELRQQRATEVLAEAETLIRDKRLETALTKVKDALELDPMCREAQKLRKKLQDDINREAVRAKVTALLEQGDAMHVQRRFSDAIQIFEDALRLDKSETVMSRVEQARSAQENAQRAARLLAEARRTAQQGLLKDALSSVSGALEADPDNTDAVRFANRLREEIHEREKERRLQEALQSAANRATEGHFTGALQILDAVTEEQGPSPEVSEARQRVLHLHAEAESKKRQQRLEQTMEAVRGALLAGNLAGARSGVDLLSSEFADLPHAMHAAQEFRTELSRRQQEADVAAVGKEVSALMQQNRVADARAVVSPVLARYPNDRKIQLILETITRVEAARERADAIARATENIARLRQAGKLEEALENARQSLNQHREHKPFRDLVAEIESEVREQQRRSAIAAAVQQGTALIDTNPAEAVELFRNAVAKLGRDPELQRALTAAEGALEWRKEQQFIEEALALSKSLRSSGQLRKALDEVERALAKYPNRPQLSAAATEIRAELDRIAREEKLRNATLAIEKAIKARDWRKSESLLKTARQDFPGEPRVAELETELASAQHAEALAALEKAVQQCFSRDDMPGADRLIKQAAPRFESEKLWQSLNVELERRKSYVAIIQQAQKLDAQARFTDAEQVLRSAMQIPIADPRAEQLLRSIVQKRERVEAEARERERLDRERKEAEARDRARSEQERKEAEARERERQERERQEAEARERARVEQERKEAEVRERERLDRERNEAEARERARLEQERKEAEARERERKERERQETEARERARVERERKEAEARERKDAEARERARLEQARKEAEARDRERQERERKEAEARERARVEQERKEAQARERERQERQRKEAREKEERERQRKEAEARERERLQPSVNEVLPAAPPPRPSSHSASGEHHAAAAQASATVILSTAEMHALNTAAHAQRPAGTTADSETAPPFADTAKQSAPIYRNPMALAAAAAGVVVVVAIGFYLTRPAPGPTKVSLQPAPAEISLKYAAGSAEPSSDINVGSVAVPFSAHSTVPWLAVEPASGDHIQVLHVKAKPEGLKPATYDGQIEIVSADSHKFTLANATIPVHLTIASRQVVELRVQPSPLQFEYRDGGPVPASKLIPVPPDQLTAVQTRWENPRDAAWARAAKGTGGLNVSVHPFKGLAVGTHTATLLVELRGATNSPVRVPVSIKVSGLGLFP